MSTLNKRIAQDIIDGKYPQDNVVKIVSYNNMFDGELSYASVYRYEYFNKYEESPACNNVKTVWLEGQEGVVL